MKIAPIWLLTAITFGGCHPHTVATPADGREAKRPATKEGEREGSAKKDDDKRKRQEGTAATPVPRTPVAALEPGQLREIQRRLGQRKLLGQHEDGNLDEPTRAALRKLQKDADLPETGLPDHETVRKLGLDPDQVFAKRRDDQGNNP